jgi:hypothetical protein
MWLKCLLGRAYGLRWLRPHETPRRADLEALRGWLQTSSFPDNTIFHQHYDYSPEIVALLQAVPATIVTIVRDPYDAFVSTYYTMQLHAESANQKGRRLTELMGKPLDDPEIISFLRHGGYENNLRKGRDWAVSGDAILFRYEDLIADPLKALRSAAPGIGPIDPAQFNVAIDYCTADRMRERTKGGKKHVRSATVGDSRTKLGQAHYDAFRAAYADLIRDLGYAVR